MMKNKGTAVTLVLFLCLAAAVLGAQDDSSQKAVGELKQSLAANQKALAQYAWNMRRAISLKGEDKNWTVEQVQIGPDGQQQKTLISKSPEPEKKRGLKGKVVGKKSGEIKDYIESMMKLAMGYAKPSAEAIQAAKKAQKVRIGPGSS